MQGFGGGIFGRKPAPAEASAERVQAIQQPFKDTYVVPVFNVLNTANDGMYQKLIYKSPNSTLRMPTIMQAYTDKVDVKTKEAITQILARELEVDIEPPLLKNSKNPFGPNGGLSLADLLSCLYIPEKKECDESVSADGKTVRKTWFHFYTLVLPADFECVLTMLKKINELAIGATKLEANTDCDELFKRWAKQYPNSLLPGKSFNAAGTARYNQIVAANAKRAANSANAANANAAAAAGTGANAQEEEENQGGGRTRRQRRNRRNRNTRRY